jgi:hypothetical protein
MSNNSMLNTCAPPLHISGGRLAGPPAGTLMTDTWWEAHRRVVRILKFLFVVDMFGTFIGVINHDGWFTIIWLVAGLIAGMIGTSERESFVVVCTPEDDEFTDEKELAEAYAFARKFAEASNLLAATMLAIGFVLGGPWWSNLLVAILAWLVGLFGIPLLCASRNNRVCDAVRGAGGSVQIVGKGFAASGGAIIVTE